MLTLMLLLAGAHASPVEDAGDARYFVDTRRAAEATPWYRARLDSGEASDGDVLKYLDALGQLPGERSRALPELLRTWSPTQPQLEAHGTLHASALAAAALPERWRRSPAVPGSGGPWCSEALVALTTEEPATPYAHYLLVRTWKRLAPPCDWEIPDDLGEVSGEIARSGDAGPWLHAWFGTQDGVDQGDLDALREALDEEPTRLGRAGHYFDGEHTGPALKAARDLLLERARALADTERPSHLWAAAHLLEAAERYPEAEAALQRIAELDPDNGSLPRVLARVRRGGHAPKSAAAEPTTPSTTSSAPPDASTVIDPQARMNALLDAGPGKSRWDKATYWGALSEAAHSVGDAELELDALDHLIDVMPRSDTRLRFAELAVEHDTHLRAARRQAARVVRDRDDPPLVGEDPTATAESWRSGLADALAVQASVLHASGHTDQAHEVLARSLVLDADHPERLLDLGLLYHELDWHEQAVAPLARGLAQTTGEGDATEQAWAALDAALDARGLWVPGGAVAFVEAQGVLTTDDDDRAEVLDGSRFEDLLVQIDGEDVRLFDIEGPLVVDVWATWCGPCMQSLPHLDGLARQYDGQVTMLAMSVDDELGKVDAYLSERGTPAFQVGWVGDQAMAELGIDGIPAMFVFDDQHRLVASLSGWGPGSRSLDRAIERMLR